MDILNKGNSGQIEVKFTEDGVVYKTNLNSIKGANLQVGDLRMVKWIDKKYYLAEVINLGSYGQVSVKYKEDRVKYNTNFKSIKGGPNLQVGDLRMVKWKDNKYYPARVIAIPMLKKGEQPSKLMLLEIPETNLVPSKSMLPDTSGTPQLTPVQILPETSKTNQRPSKPILLEIPETNQQPSKPILPEPPEIHQQLSKLMLPETPETRQQTSEKIRPEPPETHQKPSEPMLPETQETRKQPSEPMLPANSVTYQKKSIPTLPKIIETQQHRIRPPVNYKYISDDEELMDFSADESEYDPKEDGDSLQDRDTTEDDNCSVENNLKPDIHRPNDSNVASPSRDAYTTQIKINDVKDPPTFTIDTAKRNVDGKRKWDRKYNCKYCTKSFPKLPRHLKSKHANELDVASFLACPKDSNQRKAIIDKIRTEGERIHIFKTYSSNKNAIIIPKRRPTKEKDVKNFLPCEYCGMLMTKTYLSRHARVCMNRPSKSEGDSANSLATSNRLRARCAMLLPTAPDVPANFKETILQNMVYDDVFNVITCDQLILEFGIKLFETKMRRPSQYREVKDRMRELARLLMSVKTKNNHVTSLKDIIDPTKYKTIVEAAKEVAGFDIKTGLYETPSLVIKIGQSLLKCAARYKGLCMDDAVLHEKLPIIELFQERMRENWTDDVTKDAHTTLQERKWNAPQRLPMSEDVRKLNKFLTNQETLLLEGFKRSKSVLVFRKLCENTLCRLILLNRRRVGESQYIKLSDYMKSKLNTKINESEVMMSLSETEKVLVKSLQRIEIRGKRGRMVPVILTRSLQEIIQVLIEARSIVGVPESNDFLFPALHSCTGHYRADVLLRSAALKSGASNPESLTGTRLRKHVATMVQLLNLRENELDAVANYLGHDIRVHRQYYRLPHDAMQLAKVSKVLLNMENGNVNNMRGKNLDEITVDDQINDREDDIADDDEVEEAGHPKDSNQKVAHTSGLLEKADIQFSAQLQKTAKRKVVTSGAPSKRQKFSFEESKKIKKYFDKFIKAHRVPTIGDVKQFFIAYPDMIQINWARIKMFVYNCFAGKKRYETN